MDSWQGVVLQFGCWSKCLEPLALKNIFSSETLHYASELNNSERHALYSWPNIIRNFKSRRLRWAEHVARMEQCRNAYRVLVGKPERKNRLFGIVVSTSDCRPRGPGFDSRLYPRNFCGSIGSGMGSTQPHEDNWVATWMRSCEIRLRKLKLRLREKCFANHKAPCTVICQQPLQSVLALRSCSATDLI